MGRLRPILSGLIGAIFMATAHPALGSTDQLPLQALDLHGRPVPGLVFRDGSGQKSDPPTDSRGLTALVLDSETRASGWLKIHSTTSEPPGPEVLLIEPWDGWVRIGDRSGRSGPPTPLVVARLPVDNNLIDSRISRAVAAQIIMQEALHGRSVRGEDNGRHKAVEDLSSRLGIPSDLLTNSLGSLALSADSELEAGIGSLWSGNLQEAGDRLLAAWKHVEAATDPDPRAAIESATFLAIAFLQQGEPGRAAFLLSKSHHLRPDDLDLLTILGRALHKAGSFTEAESAIRQVLEGTERQFGSGHPRLSPILSNLAVLYFEQGLYDAARDLNERALDIEEAATSPDHSSLVALLTNLAAIQAALGNLSAAEPLLRRALAIEEEAHGEGSEALASTLNNLALVYFETGRLLEARQLYQRVLEIDQTSFGHSSVEVASDISNLALISDQLGSILEAERQYRQALELRQGLLEPSHPDLAKSYGNLAWLYHRQNRYPEAETLYRSALEVLDAAQGGDPLNLAWTLKSLGMLYQKLQRYDESELLYRRSLEVFESVDVGSHPDLISLLWSFAALLEETGRTEEAEKIEERARALR